MKNRFFSVVLVLFLFTGTTLSQEENRVSLGGYVTTMQSSMFEKLSGSFMNENLFHNRLNLKAYLSNSITFTGELRNRLFTGDFVRMGSYYSDIIGYDRGFADMSWNIINENSFLFNSTLDRLNIDFNFGKFQITAGRQRINWGQTFVWNPNDIFNAYSFFDFDYVERPGSDAVRLQYFISSSSAAEVAIKVDNNHDITAAGLYRFSLWGYDIQFLAGLVNSQDIVIGTGWSGAIGGLSFRGEVSWFDPYEDFPGDESTVLATAGFEKLFKKNSMAQVQIMYCNNPLVLNDFNSFYSGNLSSRDLAFSVLSAFGQFTWAATPLMSLTASAMWLPDLDGWFAGPSFDYSLTENLDFSLIWQHFDALMGGEKSKINLAFLRLKYSF